MCFPHTLPKFHPGRGVAESGRRRRVSPHSSAMASAHRESPLGEGRAAHAAPGSVREPPPGRLARTLAHARPLCQHDSPGDSSCLQHSSAWYSAPGAGRLSRTCPTARPAPAVSLPAHLNESESCQLGTPGAGRLSRTCPTSANYAMLCYALTKVFFFHIFWSVTWSVTWTGGRAPWAALFKYSNSNIQNGGGFAALNPHGFAGFCSLAAHRRVKVNGLPSCKILDNTRRRYPECVPSWCAPS